MKITDSIYYYTGVEKQFFFFYELVYANKYNTFLCIHMDEDGSTQIGRYVGGRIGR